MAFEDYYKKRPLFEEELLILPEEEQQQQEKKKGVYGAFPGPNPELGIIPETSGSKISTPDMSWWQSPNYATAERELQDRAVLSMEAQERRARNDRNKALLGDIARLGAQTWAKKGGAWMIPRTEPQTAVANERLRQLRDKHAGDMLVYAQRLQAAKDADRKDAINRETTRMSLEAQQQAQAAAQQRAQAAAQQQNFENVVELKKLNNAQENAAAKLAVDIQRLNNDVKYRNDQIAIAKQKADAYEKNVGKANGRMRTYTSPDGKESYTVPESAVKANIGTLYDCVRKDLGGTDKELQNYLGIKETYMGGSSQDAMETVVSGLWHKSPRAIAYLKMLSEMGDSEDVVDWVPKDDEIVDYEEE